MNRDLLLRLPFALIVLALACTPVRAGATVNVSVNGNVATAQIALPDANPLYQATVTIVFDSAVNLTADSLNLSAELIDPGTFAGLPANVTVDPNFPVMVTVDPPAFLFSNGFESGQVGNGNLDFLNTYEFEFHSDEHLTCLGPDSDFRLYKAAHGSSSFADVTDQIYSGSVRARGRGGAFSRFLIVHDGRAQYFVGVPVLALEKLLSLQTRLLAAPLGAVLQGTLTTLLGNVLTNVLALNIGGAIADLDNFIAEVAGNAGSGIPNEWNALDLGLDPGPNDAGELLALAQTLRFTLTQLNATAPVCQLPPPG